MRPPVFRGFTEDLIVDSFAGGGGASTGIEIGLDGRSPDIAINHSPAAIAMHRANHPDTKHFIENIWEVDPTVACAGRAVGVAWFSPDCTDHSRAKGGMPIRKETRALAWVVVRWARAVRPRIMLVENVEEFEDWGPVVNGRRDPDRLGETFAAWVAKIRSYGYHVEWRSLVAADYGAPTTRKRLFLVARCDGQPIVWPEPTHGPGRAHPHRAAAEIIDWSLPCPSIFGRKRPLAEATLKRIAIGIQRYVVNAADPFILPLTHPRDARVHSIDEPVRTITGAHRGELALAQPFLTRTAHGDVDRRGKRRGRGQHDLGAPLPTVTASRDFALAQPFIVRHGHYSKRTGAGLYEGRGAGTFRGQRLEQPLATVCATNDKHLVAPLVTKHYGGPNGHPAVGKDVRDPVGTVTARDSNGITAALITKYYNTNVGADARAPLPTVTAGGGRGGGHLAEVRTLLERFAGATRGQNQDLFDPLHTVTARARGGLVVIRGEFYEIIDIGMRMLQPPELFGAQGFPDDYIICPEFEGKPLTKTLQTELAGNSVCPDVAAALVAANVTGNAVRRAA